MKRNTCHLDLSLPDNFRIAHMPLTGSRRISLRLDPLRDTLILRHPARMETSALTDFLQARRAWIHQQIHTLPARIPLQPDATIPLLGTPVMLHNQPTDTGLQILATPAQFEAVTRKTLTALLHDEIAPHAKMLATRTDRSISRIRYADGVSRFGSCTSKGALMFHWRLIFAPRDVVHYLVAHEIAHLTHLNHSNAFWQLTQQLHPATAQSERWLKQYGHTLYRYGSALAWPAAWQELR